MMRPSLVLQGMLLGLALAVTVPFFNFMRTVPSPDWWTQALTLLFLCFVLLGSVFLSGQHAWPKFSLWALAWWLSAFLPAFIMKSDNFYLLPISSAGGVLVVILASTQAALLQAKVGRERVVTVLAATVLIAALLQATIGYLQLMGLASLAHGYLIYAAGAEQVNIVGNIAQRNQLSQFLTWGVVAAAYLFASGKLRIWLALPVMVMLSLVMAWSGGRLPLAYAVAMVMVAIVWYWRRNDRKLLLALVLGAVFMLAAQLWGHNLAHWLTGLDVNSGLDRIDEAGFGARRRIEWHKVWQIVEAYPWLGVGFGGFAFQSVWLEAFAGMVKVPENALFTHSHNLITQLLAETGVPATLLAAAAVTVCLVPYCKRDQASPENAFLILVAAAILGHSMFEYPLWYLPFLAMFFIVLALSPISEVKFPVRPLLRKLGVVLLSVATLIYLANGAKVFFALQGAVFPTANQQTNEKNIATLVAVSPNLFWSYEAELALANYLQSSRHDMEIKRRHYEQIVAYSPYPLLLTNLAMLRSWAGESDGAKDAIIMALATYPKTAPIIQARLLAMKDSSLQPLVTLASNAVQILNKSGDQAVAEAVTKGLPVRGPQIPDLSRFR